MPQSLWTGDVVIPVMAALTAAKGGGGALSLAKVGFNVSITAENEPPYPALIISDPPGGNAGGGLWLASHVVQVEAVGDPQRTIERAAVKRIAYAALAVVASLPDAAHAEGSQSPVITSVTAATPGWSPMPTGQNRYLFRATVHSHPPRT